MLTCYFFSTSANGNCLFNACSIALTGNESLSSYLRCLTSIELRTLVLKEKIKKNLS